MSLYKPMLFLSAAYLQSRRNFLVVKSRWYLPHPQRPPRAERPSLPLGE